MNIRDFKAGNFVTVVGYKAFVPELINKEWEIGNPAINTLLEKATRKLGELNAFSQMIPEIDTYIQMDVTKEATTSCRIEGTRTQIDEALLHEEGAIEVEKRDDWKEVKNYIHAMNYAIERLDKLPVSSRLLKETHKILLSNVRGENKLLGEFRTIQNWIGGASLKDAVFIPPPPTEVPDLMGDLEKFIHNEEISVPHLIKIALAHYQFETIHPFLDGNGRTGRLLITLYLVSHKLLNKPTLYLSEFFEKHKTLYYDNLMNVRLKNDVVQWIKFFMVGIEETAQKGIDTQLTILKIKDELENRTILSLGKKIPLAKRALAFIFKRPVFTVADIEQGLDLSKPTANAIVADFVKLGILNEHTGFKRNRLFFFDRYIDLFR
mgnify:CR=1 FL=1